IENWKALPGLRLVTRRQIDQCVSPVARHLRMIPDFAHLAVWHILNRIIGRTWLRNLYGTGVFAAAKKRLTPRVTDFRAINDECVVMQAGNKWRCSERPKSIGLFGHFCFGVAPEIHSDFSSLGGFDTKLNPPRAINAGIVCSPHVGRSRLKIACLLCVT